MKKEYKKPEIMFENFSLSTTVAGDCGKFNGGPSEGTCPYVVSLGAFGTADIFTSDLVGVCTTSEATDGTEDGMYNGVCYHAPTDLNNLFNS